MKEYHFYRDCKITAWERDYFSVKANSYEEAVSIVRSWKCEDVSDIDDSRLCYETREALPDTSERMLPEENNGQPTMEIFTRAGVSVITNVPDVAEHNPQTV